jgi:hypothetical protein
LTFRSGNAKVSAEPSADVPSRRGRKATGQEIRMMKKVPAIDTLRKE